MFLKMWDLMASSVVKKRIRGAMRAKLIGVVTAAVLVAVAAVLLGSGALRGGPPSAAETTTTPNTTTTLSPYIDTSLSSDLDMAATARKTGVKDFTLGFVVSGNGCDPKWGGTDGLTNTALDQRITALREAGGDVRVSFGGADGTELAQACGSVSGLAAAYRTVIDRYGLTRLDFDIENAALADTAANTRRSQAIARLQKNARLDVTFTLPATPDGLSEEVVAQLAEAKAQGVRISTVNILAMDYGESLRGDMGQYAVQAATAVHAQIEKALGLSSSAAWKALGVTPMIGANDIAGEVFTVSDATRLAEFARDMHVGLLSMWAADRDTECAGGAQQTVRSTCSGVTQQPLAFMMALAGAARRSGT
jgi:chitinase